jgi:peptide/nickel transport system permease protein
MIKVKQFFSRWQNLLAVAMVGCYVLVAAVAPQLSPSDDPENPSPFKLVGKNTDVLPRPPSEEAPLGTLPRGMDVYHTLVWGTRSALRFGLVVALSTAFLGIIIGAVGAYFGGLFNGLTMRVTDAFLTFPTIAGVWLFRQILLPPRFEADATQTWLQRTVLNLELNPVTVTLILFSWMPYARIINTTITQLKQTEFVVAARSLGAGHRRIIVRHLLPNAIAPAIVLAARDVGAMVLLESAFTFIGIGGSTHWGTILVMGRDYVIGLGGNPLAYWWTFAPATLALVFFGIGWNLLGDGLNTLLNPRTAR